MSLSWNEIRIRAAAFADKWKDAGYEKGETQTFYNEFFDVFGISRQSVGRYEERVKKLDNSSGFIDLFWPGTLIVEQKSAGRDLEKAYGQAGEYFDSLSDSDRPRYILVSDFQTFELHDLADRQQLLFRLPELPDHVDSFAFITGVQRRTFRDQAPANVKAADLVGRLHDALDKSGYRGQHLEQFLVRIVFCLFADDTGIFDTQDMFLDFIETRTREDGSDVGAKLTELFQVLNTPKDERQKARDEDIARFPYINGDLFKEQLRIPAFDSAMRIYLLDACNFNWSNISPAIFGALFQSVMDPVERRAGGAHYTTEKNILKVIEPMFMDDLRAEFNRLKGRKDSRRATRLKRFQERLATLRLFDPACGCGNFLIIAYRELRELEMEVIKEIRQSGQLDVLTQELSLIDVDQFYGIEIIQFPALIAETALWMMDHIMNKRLSLEFGEVYARIPLERSPHIHVGNALETDWNEVLPARECSYVFGNPPFVGHQWRTKPQQADMARIWGKAGQVNRLDYVTCWFNLAALYAKENRDIDIAFVSTNSITQGEQCGILWPVLFGYNLSIRFAHRTFQWQSEVRGRAAVHCVIVGLTFSEDARRTIYEYDDIQGDPSAIDVARINGYLIDGPQYTVPARSSPPQGRIKMHKGSQPTDGARLKLPEGGYRKFSNLILDADDRDKLLAAAPACEKWLRPYVGSDELISGNWRWCLWLKDADPSELRASKPIVERLERVRAGRLQSPTASVREYADYPTLFTQDRQPDKEYLAIPEVSSEIREYIPIAILQPSVIASNKLQIIPGAPIEYFGILISAMHMAWIRTVAGRLKSDFSYSPAVYNSFPWPDTDKGLLADLSTAILDARQEHPGASLADLYDPVLMPPKLRKTHQTLDRAVDRLYRKSGFKSERERIEHLFTL
ncbi:MAG: class I SAM-dependent DNA methyltransferase [Gammaproteobacteria bacterium]|nr:class I SAM-dependent DNA methyltransferase [Gammaproteobacteria bacterium]